MQRPTIRVKKIKGGYLALDQKVRLAGRGPSEEAARQDLADGLELWEQVLQRLRQGRGAGSQMAQDA